MIITSLRLQPWAEGLPAPWSQPHGNRNKSGAVALGTVHKVTEINENLGVLVLRTPYGLIECITEQ